MAADFSASLQPFQRILRHLVLGVELQRGFIFFHRIFQRLFSFS